MNRSRFEGLRAAFLILTLGLAAAIAGAGGQGLPEGVEYAHLQRQDPRPLKIHVLRIDLRAAGIEMAVSMPPDPDGAGPAETTLNPPLDHARPPGFVAAVNANAWTMVPKPAEGTRPRYAAGGACDVCGWVVADGVDRSPPEAAYWSIWLDREGRARIGARSESVPGARWAVSGFGGLLRDGAVLPSPSETLHPRTAAGVDREGRRLTLVTVDGRQKRTSEGMSERELADLMLELGCHDALNLDGGGSTAMVVAAPDGAPRIVNRPSDASGPRPVPVVLGVRPARARK